MHVATTIPRRLTQGTELIVMRRTEYEQLQQHLVEARDALAKIRRGDQAYRAGQTRVIRSLADLRR